MYNYTEADWRNLLEAFKQLGSLSANPWSMAIPPLPKSAAPVDPVKPSYLDSLKEARNSLDKLITQEKSRLYEAVGAKAL